MADYRNVDAECVHCCGSLAFRVWWVIDRDDPEKAPSRILLCCLACGKTSELRNPEPATIRWGSLSRVREVFAEYEDES